MSVQEIVAQPGQPQVKAHKVHVLSDAHVRITLWVASQDYAYQSHERMQSYARDLDRAAKDFSEFIHDHRHQDCTGVEVVREYKDVCSACSREWDTTTDDETGRLVCGYCGVEVEL